MRRQFLTGLAAGLATGLTTRAGIAQTATSSGKPVRFIVGLGPGSGADTGTRFIAERFSKLTGQPAIVENRTGADQVIAVQSLLQAPPDGLTLMYITPSPMVLTPLLNPATPYDPLRDVRPVVYGTRSQAVIVTGANSRFKTLQDVLTEARAKPESVRMSNYGHHYRIGGLSLQKATGAVFTHVTYKGAAQANNDVISGDIDVAITDTGGAMPLLEGGKLRALAVTGPNRHQFLPNVATVKELGINYELIVWTGFAASSKVPDAIAQKLEELLLTIIKSPEYKEYNDKQGGGEIVAGSGAMLRALIEAETARYREMGKTMKLTQN